MGVIVVDLDGTLVDPQGAVSQPGAAALRDARAAGWQVLIATGRSWSECRQLLDEAGVDGPVITAGGATVTQHPGGMTLDAVAMEEAQAQLAAEILISHGLGVLGLLDPDHCGVEYLHIGPHPLHAVSAWWHEHHGHSIVACPSLDGALAHGPMLRIAAVADAESFAAPMSELEARLSSASRAWHWAAVIDQAQGHAPVHLLEVFSRSACKWAMVERWCRSNGFDPDQVVAIGDGRNDVELIRHAPLGIAMGNADAQVLAVADHVAPSNAQHGVAHAVEALLEGALAVPS
ncbi:MAG: HAD family hydrolase [Phycisphaerales bacterium]|nr:HAD family hydrolase [Phycisphaerales bacterium]